LLRTAGIPWHLVGKGTNLIVRDGGIRGVVLHIGDAFSGIEIGEGSLVTAGAGASLSAVANAAADAGLAGLEALSGIPGSVGGALFMNAGAYGREMSDIVHSAHVYDIFNDNIITVNKEKMRLGYRVSAFQETGGILLHVTMALSADSPGAIRERMRDYRARRDGKQPMGQPSAGSFFKRPEGAYAGQLIEEAGLKGARQGGASVSEVHAGFIVNDGDASAADVLLLMARVQQTVFEQSGIHLEPEPRIIGEDAG
ncbi:MAG: UDP-N-acetylmuramate dehydrogenase, partial [Clostridiales Family XIII bacterium]|nr:UDP-N-acetylmuramate dehydrogenase [Clostridiales Family XIII bacterium]